MDIFNQLNNTNNTNNNNAATSSSSQTCMLTPDIQMLEANADDILIDEDLLEFFRIIKQFVRKRPSPEDIAKLLFCVCYALYDHVKFIKPAHEDKIVFYDEQTSEAYGVKLTANTSCCQVNQGYQRWLDTPIPTSTAAGYNLLLQTPYRPFRAQAFETNQVMPYTDENNTMLYYPDIRRDSIIFDQQEGLLQPMNLVRKRKRYSTDSNQDNGFIKKAKIPHRHGEFESRRDDIINRLRNITIEELEQKAQKLPEGFRLSIEHTFIPSNTVFLTEEEKAKLLEPSLRVLTNHSNKKPHLDNGMNQNGIYYNTDYFQLYLAFEQFQKTFAALFPHEIVQITKEDKDRDRNSNMKSYRPWIESRLIDSNWPAFRRNIVVGERMMQLTKSIGQGALFITKELSGSKLHLTFTNSEWDEFIIGLNSNLWDNSIDWSKSIDLNYLHFRRHHLHLSSLLITELQEKFASYLWFSPNLTLIPTHERKLLLSKRPKGLK